MSYFGFKGFGGNGAASESMSSAERLKTLALLFLLCAVIATPFILAAEGLNQVLKD